METEGHIPGTNDFLPQQILGCDLIFPRKTLKLDFSTLTRMLRYQENHCNNVCMY